MKKFNSGFTLIEAMIVVAIIGIIAAVALPSYAQYILQAKRGDAKAALLNATLAQEKYRANNTTYGSLAEIDVNSASPDGYYTIAISGTNATSYTVTATPGHTDAICNVLSVIKTSSGLTKTESGTGDYDDCFKK